MNFLRNLTVKIVTVAVIVLGATSATPKLAFAASGPKLIINEFNWAGSPVSPQDQWVEIFNPDIAAVDFSTAPYKLAVNGTDLVTLSAGSVPAKGFFLVSRLNPAVAGTSSLKPTTNPFVAASLVIPTSNAQLQLIEVGGSYTDVANAMIGNPFDGNDGMSGDMIIASQYRQPSPSGYYAPGNSAGSWMTSQTYGGNFVTGTMQYGTPAISGTTTANVMLANPELSVPMTAGVTQSVINEMPYVNASFSTPADGLKVTFIQVGSGVRTEGVPNLPLGYQPASPLAPGLYQIIMATTDLSGGMSRSIVVPIHSNSIDQYLVYPRAGFVTPPVFNPVPSPTNLTSVMVSGKVQPGTRFLRYTINGGPVMTFVFIANSPDFSFPVSLTLSGTTTISALSVAPDMSESTPATLSIVQDSSVPAALILLTVASNVAGTQDTVSGAAGSGEPGATVFIYGDVASTILLATGTMREDGSFGPLQVGDDAAQTLYAFQQDAAGNRSEVRVLSNPRVLATPSPTPTPTATATPAATASPTATPAPVASTTPTPTPPPAAPLTGVGGGTPDPQAGNDQEDEVALAAQSSGTAIEPSPSPSSNTDSDNGDVRGAQTEATESWLSQNWWWLLLLIAAIGTWFYLFFTKRRKEEDQTIA